MVNLLDAMVFMLALLLSLPIFFFMFYFFVRLSSFLYLLGCCDVGPCRGKMNLVETVSVIAPR